MQWHSKLYDKKIGMIAKRTETKSVSASRVETVSKVQTRHHHESATQIQFSVHSTETLHGASTATVYGLYQVGIQSGHSGQVLLGIHSQSYAWSETTCSQKVVCQETIDSLSPCSCQKNSNGDDP